MGYAYGFGEAPYSIYSRWTIGLGFSTSASHPHPQTSKNLPSSTSMQAQSLSANQYFQSYPEKEPESYPKDLRTQMLGLQVSLAIQIVLVGPKTLVVGSLDK